MITEPQNTTNTEIFSAKQLNYVDFVACGGLFVDEDGKITRVTAVELAKQLKVDRGTLYNWRELPGFWDTVRERRNILYGQTRMSMIYNAMFKKALSGDMPAAKLLLNQARMLEADKQEIEHSGQVIVQTVSYADASDTV